MTTITATTRPVGQSLAYALSGATTGKAATSGGSSSSGSSSAAVDTVSFSDAAVSALTTSTTVSIASSAVTAGQTSYYEQFFPTRSGTDASALADAVANPGLQTISTGLTPDEVAAAARASMNAEYAAMNASGTPYNPNSKDGVDQDTLMSGLDRTALAAVAQNQGGLFTKDEQDVAQSLMESQEGLATGNYAGPIDEESKYVDPTGGDDAAKAKAVVSYLDKASSYEQGTISWALGRASAQVGYEWIMEGRGETPEDLDSTNTLANLLARAMRSSDGNMQNNPNASTEADLLAEPWMQGYASELEEVLASQNKSGSTTSST